MGRWRNFFSERDARFSNYQIVFGNKPDFGGSDSPVEDGAGSVGLIFSGGFSIPDLLIGGSTDGDGVGDGVVGDGVDGDGVGSGRDRPGYILGVGVGIGSGDGTSIGSGSGDGVAAGIGVGSIGTAIGFWGTFGGRIGAGVEFSTAGVGLGLGFGAANGTLQPVTWLL
jgi:hypothetical protein